MRILTLSTYPIAVPRHGGQQRLSHIVRRYRAAGHQTQAVGVLGGGHYDAEEGFLPFPAGDRLSRQIANPFLMEDWAIGRLAATDDEFFAALCAAIDGTPDLVHVEQPWLWGFAQRYARQSKNRAMRLVYGSQNVEHELKRRIVAGYMGAAHAQQCADLVLKCEIEAASSAALAVATSQADAQWLQDHAHCEVILAPNGVPERKSTVEGVTEANRITQGARTALYCASAHPPNVVGFYDLFGRGIGFLAPDERLVVAGSAGRSIKDQPAFMKTPGLASHFIDAGEVSEECLQGLLETCHAVVLPITQGGGTNLKTAEALWAGRRVVATPVAMRGFERFSTLRGVDVCADPQEFRVATRKAMQSPPLRLDAEERTPRRALLWESTLELLTTRVTALAQGPR